MATLTKTDEYHFDCARRGDLDTFTKYYFRLPWSGTWYTPEDRVVQYAILRGWWEKDGRPKDEFTLRVDNREQPYKVHFGQYGDEPAFLFPHGYIFLDWFKDMIATEPDVFVAEGGTGSAKTNSCGILACVYGAIHPGFDFCNLAPTGKQANDMLREVRKWITGSEFERFIVKSRTGRLFKQVLGVYEMIIDCGLGTYSTFRCYTIGEREASHSLGDEVHWANVDEAGLVDRIDDVKDKLTTRVRGTDRLGIPRHSTPSLSFLSNPHDNASFDRLKVVAKEQMEEKTEALNYYYANPPSDVNIYVTARQRELHRGLLSGAAQARWLDGKDTMFESQGIISRGLMRLCYDEGMDREIEQSRIMGAPYMHRERIGITHYELPPKRDHFYVAFGDPGTVNMTSIDQNNVPVTGVADLTFFPQKPIRLVALNMIDGGGKWSPWANDMLRLMDKYQATAGAYDATSAQSILTEFPLSNYPNILPVSMAGNNKAIARTFFILVAGAGLFAWPYIEPLWYQARKYREKGKGAQRLPDDIIASLFILSWYVRYTHYHELPESLKYTEEVAHSIIDEIKEQNAKKPIVTRYSRGKGRYARRNR